MLHYEDNYSYLCRPNQVKGFLEKLDTYRIDLKGMQSSSEQFDFHLDDSFFADVEAPDVQKGKVDVTLSVRKTSHAFDLHFHAVGYVIVTCDRCLDEMEQPIESDDLLHVRFGSSYAEEDDNRVVVPEDEGVINVAWFLYEFIALAIPMKHVHAPGECNGSMDATLHRYLCVSADDLEAGQADEDDTAEDEDRPIDPCWNELKKILDNN